MAWVLGRVERLALFFAAVLVFAAGASAFLNAPQFVIQGSFGSLEEHALFQQRLVQSLVGVFLAGAGLATGVFAWKRD
jgi:divalent metal cation (Fe/Co/Zn/Cd) transporter